MNKMKEVAQLFGLELYEEFKLLGKSIAYRFTEDQLECRCETGWRKCYFAIEPMLRGEFEIDRPILTKKEKEYLATVIKPFRKNVQYIKKDPNHSELKILSRKSQDGKMCFVSTFIPLVEDTLQFNGMDPNKKYTLDELFNVKETAKEEAE